MADKTTTIRLTDDDQECVAALRKRTGVQSMADVLRLALRAATLDSAAVAQTVSGAAEIDEQLRARLLETIEAQRRALDLWHPTTFEETRAKARADEAYAVVAGGLA